MGIFLIVGFSSNLLTTGTNYLNIEIEDHNYKKPEIYSSLINKNVTEEFQLSAKTINVGEFINLNATTDPGYMNDFYIKNYGGKLGIYIINVENKEGKVWFKTKVSSWWEIYFNSTSNSSDMGVSNLNIDTKNKNNYLYIVFQDEY